MADEMYDADGDVSRYLQSPGPESHLLTVAEIESEATHVRLIQHAPTAPQIQAHPAPQMPNPAPALGFQGTAIRVEHQQAPASSLQASSISVEHQQVPASGLQVPTINVEHQQAPACGPQATTINAEHQQAPASCLHAPTIYVEHDQAPAMDVQPPQMLTPEQQQAYGVPDPTLVQGSGLDDTPSWFEDMLDSGVGSPSLYEQFINDGEEELAATVGRIEDGDDDVSSAEAPPPNNDAHTELELDMLRLILSTPAANGVGAEAAAPAASQPVTQAEENTNAADTDVAFDWAGFQPEILESSHCRAYDPESSTSALLYPSLVEKQHEREQARLSKLSTDDAAKFFDKNKEDAAKELKLSSASLKLLCRKDNTYRMHSRRINDINRKMTKLERTARYVSSSGLFLIKQKMEMFKHEKAQLYAEIKKGLQEYEKNNDGAGSSGTK